MRRTLLAHIFLLAVTMLSYAGNIFWQRPILHYIKQDYQGDNQNWKISQSQKGWMYFANNKGLLEYDGAYWNTYPIGHNTKARAVYANHEAIYVGGLGEFGYFVPNAIGHLTYHSLSQGIKADRAINVWNIMQIGPKIYFQADNAIYIYQPGRKVETIACPANINQSATIGDKLFVATDKSLCVLSGKQIVCLSNTEAIGRNKVVGMLNHRGNVLIATETGGLFVYDGHQLQNYLPNLLPLLQGKHLSCAAIDHDLLALGTLHNGVLLYNIATQEADPIAANNGLQYKSVQSCAFDNEQNLWLGYYNGIDCLNVGVPLRFLGGNSDIGSGYASCLYNGQLYLGTNQGVYRTAIPDAQHLSAEADLIGGTDGLNHCLLVYDGSLFCGGKDYFVRYQGSGSQRFGIRGVWHILAPQHATDKLILGTYWGLYLLSKAGGTWQQPTKIKDKGISAKTMCMEDGTNAIWVANKNKGIWRMTLAADYSRITKAKQYNTNALPIGSNVDISIVDGNVTIAAQQGLFRYNITDDKVEEYTQLEQLLHGKTAYSYIYQDMGKNIWYVADGTLYVKTYNAKRGQYSQSESKAWLHTGMIQDYENVTVDGTQAYIGTEDGFATLQMQGIDTQSTPMQVQIRKLFTTAQGTDSLLYEHSATDKTTTDQMPHSIAYKEGTLRIEYSASDFTPTHSVLYSYKLEGSGDEKWSSFSPQHSKEYTHLYEGTYTFRVRAKLDGTSQTSEASLTFRVLPPWYRSWWAYTLYLLMLGAIIYYAIYRIRESKQKLVRKNQEQMERQQRIFDTISEEKDKKIESLRIEKTEIELRIKNDELINSQLNVVRKNEILQDIKSAVTKITNSIDEDNLPSAKRRLIKLMTQINTNISHDEDLQAFQGSFNAVHHDFLNILSERFPDLSHKEKMLCVYIKMNMQTKEIAPLLGISVRGVEISRYRVRKKLGIEERGSITDFLQKLTAPNT